jgi:hypothetical protein
VRVLVALVRVYGTASQKIDYVLLSLSPNLFDKVTVGAIFRMGVGSSNCVKLEPGPPAHGLLGLRILRHRWGYGSCGA